MRKTIILLLSLYFVSPVNGFAAHYDASQLGRLLTTPEQRHKVDATRKGENSASLNEKPSPSDVKMQGVVISSGGKSTVWIDGKNTLKSSRVDGVDVRLNTVNSRTGAVTVVINRKPVRMKPGQVWSEGTGKTSDGY